MVVLAGDLARRTDSPIQSCLAYKDRYTADAEFVSKFYWIPQSTWVGAHTTANHNRADTPNITGPLDSPSGNR